MSAPQRTSLDPITLDGPLPVSDWKVPSGWELTRYGMTCGGFHATDYQIGVDQDGVVVFRDAHGEHRIPPVPEDWFLRGGLGPHWAYQQITQQYGAPIGKHNGETVDASVRLCQTLLCEVYEQLMPAQVHWPAVEIEPLDEATAKAQAEYNRDRIRTLRNSAQLHRRFAAIYESDPEYPFGPTVGYRTIEEHLARAAALDAEADQMKQRIKINPTYPFTAAA